MNNKRINALLKYHRTIKRVSNNRLAQCIGKCLRTYQTRLEEPSQFTICELMTIFDELKLTRAERVEFFEEVIRAWARKS